METMDNILTAAERRQLVDRLRDEQASCVIRNGTGTRIFRERGVKDLFRLFEEEPAFLAGAFVADKVVGKGAAALMVLGGVCGVYAEVVSSPALGLFAAAHIPVEYGLEVPHIINRAKTGWCPVETLCRDCRTAEECLPLIRGFIAGQQ